HFDYARLKARSYVFFDYFFAPLLLIVDKIDDSRLQSAETEIETSFFQPCPRKIDTLFSLLGQTIDVRPSGIWQFQRSRYFVKRFSRIIIKSLSNQFI